LSPVRIIVRMSEPDYFLRYHMHCNARNVTSSDLSSIVTGRILCRFQDKAIYWLKIASFSYPFYITTPWRKQLRIILRRLSQPSQIPSKWCKQQKVVCLLMLTRVTDKQTDNRKSDLNSGAHYIKSKGNAYNQLSDSFRHPRQSRFDSPPHLLVSSTLSSPLSYYPSLLHSFTPGQPQSLPFQQILNTFSTPALLSRSDRGT